MSLPPGFARAMFGHAASPELFEEEDPSGPKFCSVCRRHRLTRNPDIVPKEAVALQKTIHLAIKNDDVDTLAVALKNHLRIYKGQIVVTSLREALLQRRSPDMIRELLKGADKDMHFPVNQYEDEEVALEVVQLLLEHGVSPTRGADDSLRQAIKQGHMRVLKLLLQNGADVNKRGCHSSPLCVAIENRNLDAVKLLLESGARVNGRGRANRTLVHVAVEAGNTEVLEMLVTKGVDLEATTKKDISPMHLAAETGNVPMMNVLMGHGVELDESVLKCQLKGLEVAQLLLTKFPLHPGHMRNLLECIQQCDVDIARAYFEAGFILSPEEAAEQIDSINSKFARKATTVPRMAQDALPLEAKAMVELINTFTPCGPLMPKRKLRSNSAMWPST